MPGLDALERLGTGTNASMIVAEKSYELSDPTVDFQIVSLKASGADLFYNMSTPEFAAQSIRKIGELGWKPVHFLEGNALAVGQALAMTSHC